jgi:hypothetical protein
MVKGTVCKEMAERNRLAGETEVAERDVYLPDLTDWLAGLVGCGRDGQVQCQNPSGVQCSFQHGGNLQEWQKNREKTGRFLSLNKFPPSQAYLDNPGEREIPREMKKSKVCKRA